MSEDTARSIRVAGAVDLLSIARFQDELRRAAKFFRPRLPAADALAEAVKKIQSNPAFAQSRVLTRILSALTYQEGEFRRAEASLLDSDTLFMVLTLMDGYAAGTPVREEWIRAVDAARAAELSAGG